MILNRADLRHRTNFKFKKSAESFGEECVWLGSGENDALINKRGLFQPRVYTVEAYRRRSMSAVGTVGLARALHQSVINLTVSGATWWARTKSRWWNVSADIYSHYCGFILPLIYIWILMFYCVLNIIYYFYSFIHRLCLHISKSKYANMCNTCRDEAANNYIKTSIHWWINIHDEIIHIWFNEYFYFRYLQYIYIFEACSVPLLWSLSRMMVLLEKIVQSKLNNHFVKQILNIKPTAFQFLALYLFLIKCFVIGPHPCHPISKYSGNAPAQPNTKPFLALNLSDSI